MLPLICQGLNMLLDLDLKAYLIGAHLRLGALELSLCVCALPMKYIKMNSAWCAKTPKKMNSS